MKTIDFKDVHKIRLYFGFPFEEIMQMPYWLFMIYKNGVRD